MKGKIISDWTKVDLSSRVGQVQFIGAMQAFMNQPTENPELKAAFQAFATKGDFPADVLSVIEKFHATPNYDLGFEQIFDIRDFRNTKESGFEILSVESGLTFGLVEAGMKANVYKMSGEKTQVNFDRYGAGLEWDRTWFEDQKWWMIEDNAIAFRNKAVHSRAANHYALIEAVASTYNVAWQNPTPAALPNTDARYTMSRDANTISKACEDILIRTKDSGYGVSMATPFVVLAPIQLRTRINQALAWMQQDQNMGTSAVQYSTRPIFTMMLSSSSDYYVILPKHKLKGGTRQDLTLFGEFDMLKYADLAAGWMRYGAAIGDVKQISRCASA